VSAADTAAGFAYDWSVSKNGSPFASGTGAQIDFTPDDNGDYVLTVRATDKDGGVSDPVSRQISVGNQAPTAVLANSGPVGEGAEAVFGFSSQSDAGADVASGFTYAWDWNDDGVFEVSGSTSSSASHAFADDGSYTVRGRIYDKDGGFSEYLTAITVNNVAPTASVIAPATIQHNKATTFTLLACDPSSVDAAGQFTWYIDWEGKGKFTKPVSGANGTTVTHAFEKGDYTIQVYAIDQDGGIGAVSQLLIHVV
jgi:hypothetical protein